MGGVDEFLAHCAPPLAPHTAFFSLPSCRSMFADHLAAITSRINTVNGRRYSEDPTIFAWDLLNEPRCKGSARIAGQFNGGDCHDTIQVRAVSRCLRELDIAWPKNNCYLPNSIGELRPG